MIYGAGETAQEKYHGLSQKASDLGEKVKDAARDAGETAQEKHHGLSQKASERSIMA
jgi:hypothetical protein